MKTFLTMTGMVFLSACTDPGHHETVSAPAVERDMATAPALDTAVVTAAPLIADTTTAAFQTETTVTTKKK